MPDWVRESARAIGERWQLLLLAVIGGAVLGVVVRAIAVLARVASHSWWPAIGIGALAGLVAALIWLFARATLARVRVTKVTLRFGGADAEVALDPDSRRQLWRFFIEMTSRVATREFPAEDGVLEEALTSLYSLFDRARADLSANPPSELLPPGTVPPHVYVLDILNEDLRPCLSRWHVRREAWKRTGLPESVWPLCAACRVDLEATRQRVVLRAWQLAGALGIPDCERLLPPRPPPVAAPAIISAAALAEAERAATGGAGAEPKSLEAGWHIYVELATRIATQDPAAGTGLIGEAIASLYVLSGEVRKELKSVPPFGSGGRADSIEGLGLRILNEGLRPFLAEWHPRYERFKATGKEEGEWDEADACRTALAATRERCLPLARALSQKVGAPALP